VLLATLAVPVAAEATPHHSNGLTHVRGNATVIDPEAGTLSLDGGLLGTLYTTEFEVVLESPAMDVQKGREHFVGCIDSDGNGKCGTNEPTGEFRTEYVYWATFDTKAGRLLGGECAHPIISGTGDFAGMGGLINMFDRQVGSEIRTNYTADLSSARGAYGISS
jgi:hypothetical protein